jgi:crossover junction endodeoxyribonuclease RuvC
MNFVGIDPSYNGFAIVILDKDANIIDQKLIKSKSSDEIEDRILYIEKKIQFLTKLKELYYIYIEGPSYSSTGSFVLQMGALHYYLRIFFRKNIIPYMVITPPNLKKFVTGKGQAKKELILLKTYKRWKIEFEDNNLCDAYGLARMALEDYNNVNTQIPKQNSNRTRN